MPTKKATAVSGTAVSSTNTRSRAVKPDSGLYPAPMPQKSSAKISGKTVGKTSAQTSAKQSRPAISSSPSLTLDELRTAFASLSPADQKTLLAEWIPQGANPANSLTQLVELVQKEYGANLTTEVWTEGAAHIPLVYCKITLPNGTEYTASGKNQKAAKQLAAEEALADLQNT